MPDPSYKYSLLYHKTCRQSFLLAAHALGLGAVWTSVYPEMRKVKAFSRNLNLPGNLIPMSSIMIGYPDEAAEVKDKWDENKITILEVR